MSLAVSFIQIIIPIYQLLKRVAELTNISENTVSEYPEINNLIMRQRIQFLIFHSSTQVGNFIQNILICILSIKQITIKGI